MIDESYAHVPWFCFTSPFFAQQFLGKTLAFFCKPMISRARNNSDLLASISRVRGAATSNRF